MHRHLPAIFGQRQGNFPAQAFGSAGDKNSAGSGGG